MSNLDNQRLDRAVQLATAFIANGDIRLNNSSGVDSPGMVTLQDLITSLYARLVLVEEELADY